MGPDHTPKNRNADDSGIPLRNVVWASRPQSGITKGCHPPWFLTNSAGGYSRPSTGKNSGAHQGRAQGGDQAPLAAIARVSAAKSEPWSLVFCLRM